MNSHIVKIALIVNSAMLASGMHFAAVNQPPHTALPAEGQQKASPMMRRELPKLKMGDHSKEAEEEEEVSQISISAQGKQIVADRVEEQPQHDAGAQSVEQQEAQEQAVVEQRASVERPAEKQRQQEAQESAPAEPAAPEEPKHQEAAAAVEEPQPQRQEAGASKGEEKPEESIPDSAALTQESEMETSSTGVQQGQDEKVQHPAKLSDEDEELYYKLFPEDKEAEIQKAVSALEVSGARKNAFRIKVPVSGGKRLCLTEDHYGYKVRAEPCRRSSDRQKWYWTGAKLMNLFSKGRCLGLAHKKNNVATNSELEGGKTEAQSHLTMSFHCSDAKAPLGWGLDEHGRLMSKFNSQCMAINEHENFHAVVLPCDKAAGEE